VSDSAIRSCTGAPSPRCLNFKFLPRFISKFPGALHGPGDDAVVARHSGSSISWLDSEFVKRGYCKWVQVVVAGGAKGEVTAWDTALCPELARLYTT
jgi:hypothetical protein